MRLGIAYDKLLLTAYPLFLASLYVPGIMGAATSSRWIYLSLATPLLMLCVGLGSFTLTGTMFVIWALVSINSLDGIDFGFKLLVLCSVFLLGTRLDSLKPIFLGLGLGLIVSSVATFFGWQAGLFVNVNVLAETTALVIVGLVCYRLYYLIPFLIPCLLTGSKGSIAALVLTGLIYVCNVQLYCLALIVGVVYFVNYRWTSIAHRIEIWSDTVNGLTIFGHGLGTYFSTFPLYSNMNTMIERPRFAHNDYLQIAFELGIVGLVLFLLFCFNILMQEKKEKYVVICFMLIACFSFPVHLPVSAFIFAITCGYLFANRNVVFLSFGDGRISFKTGALFGQARG